MTLNSNDSVVANASCTYSDMVETSAKMLENYSIVSRKQLDKIVNNSERCLTEEEHRWLIKRECAKVISEINRRIQQNYSLDIDLEEENYMLDARNQYAVLSKNEYCQNNNLSVNNFIIQNNVTIVNFNQANVNLSSQYITHEYDDKIFETIKYKNRNRNNSLDGCTLYNTNLQKKYWIKWRDYVVRKKMSNKTTSRDCSKIDMFLTQIREKLNEKQSMKKSKTNKEHHRNGRVAKQIKTAHDRQQTRIESQKKLLEKQQKEIERLKIQQLKLESEKAMLENQKMLHRMAENKPKTTTNSFKRRSTSMIPSTSDILNRMQLRALDRQAKWEGIKERRRAMEQDERRKKEELEEKSLREQMELKRKKLFEARENLRQKKIQECKQQMERDVLREKLSVAAEFDRKLKIKTGLDAFKINLNNVRMEMRRASDFYDYKTVAMIFNKWRFYTNNVINEQIQISEQHYKKNLLRRTFHAFYKILEDNRIKEQVAEDWNNFKIQECWFQEWLNYTREMQKQMEKKILRAELHHNRVITRHCFNNWRKYPEIVYMERLKDGRLRKWHEKVQEILPDFIPPDI
ncbi:coiled-coil domain-containing protein 191 [Adelges cooleyi]|uniref:coiled-coil domain-containing protein 191 n=1 Tax=Adelges cooleyi TaxID=133065 RepID=UPI00217FBAD1|nr:coiled-coil domain-containing protein 191 [Adelges cooleyi]